MAALQTLLCNRERALDALGLKEGGYLRGPSLAEWDNFDKHDNWDNWRNR